MASLVPSRATVVGIDESSTTSAAALRAGDADAVEIQAAVAAAADYRGKQQRAVEEAATDELTLDSTWRESTWRENGGAELEPLLVFTTLVCVRSCVRNAGCSSCHGRGLAQLAEWAQWRRACVAAAPQRPQLACCARSVGTQPHSLCDAMKHQHSRVAGTLVWWSVSMLTLVAIIVSLAADSFFIPSWSALRADAGPAAARLFSTDQRLFSAAAPSIVFWRDSAGWCPFCQMTWMLLEHMRVPYQVRTVPLRQYLRPGETKDPEYLALVGSDGVVPGLQFADEDGRFGPVVQSVEHIFEELERRWPNRFPSGDDSFVRSRACEGERSIFGRLRVARRSFEACAGAATQAADKPALGPPLPEALLELDSMLADAEADGTPFFGGDSLAVSDMMLLPFLERTAAVVPYFFGSDALAVARDADGTGGVQFARAARYLERARASERTCYGALSSDDSTLARTNLRYAAVDASPRYSVPAMAVDAAAAAQIDGVDASTRDAWAAASSKVARRDAAARLAANAERVVAFALRCASAPFGSSAEDEAGAEGAAWTGKDATAGSTDADRDGVARATDAALRAVASLLLHPEADDLSSRAAGAATALQARHGRSAAVTAAVALDALSLNVGVPRDMGVEAARACRSHCRILAEALRSYKRSPTY